MVLNLLICNVNLFNRCNDLRSIVSLLIDVNLNLIVVDVFSVEISAQLNDKRFSATNLADSIKIGKGNTVFN